MKDKKQYALVTLKWLAVDPPLHYPRTKAFGGTGYRESDGPDGLFSVYVVLLNGNQGAGEEQQARLFALVDQMDERLPQPGERFVLTAGAKPVAEAVATARGEGPP
jgi:hypothetical protein